MRKDPERSQRTEQVSVLASELRAVFGKLKRRLREQSSDGDLPPSQISVLLRLEKDGPATASSLARAEGMRPQSMGAVISALQAAGFVRGSPDPDDARQTLLSLTDTCREWIREGRAARQDWLIRTIQSRFTAKEQKELASAVRLLERLVED